MATLVRAIDPAGSVLAGLLGAVGKQYDLRFAREVADRLRDVVELLTVRETSVVFGGHYSCGKSSLINALIGKPLLPTSDFPETGVACVIRAGTTDRIQMITNDGRENLHFSTEAIAREVSLITGSGEYSTAVQGVRRLAISLAGNTPPNGVLWIDSPGINDLAAMTDRAAAAAAAADVLVWVVNSRQPLSEVEKAFLHAHVATHGPAGVLFVVNAFLRTDDAATWTWFLNERLGYFRSRIAEASVVDPLTPVVVPVSARATMASLAGFGGPEVRGLLVSLDGSDHPRVRATRCCRAGQQVRELIEKIRAHGEKEGLRIQRDEAARAELVHRGRQRRDHFSQQIELVLASMFTRGGQLVEQCTQQILHKVAVESLHRDNTYGNSLTSGLADIGEQLADEIIAETKRHAKTAGLKPLTPTARSQLRSLLHPSPIVVDVVNTPIASTAGPRGVGAVIGGILGTLIAPGIGSMIGVSLGAAAGGAATDPVQDSVNRDRAGTRTNLIAASQAAAARMLSMHGAVHRLVTDPASTPPVLPNPPARDALHALEALHKHLGTTVLPQFITTGDAELRKLAV